MVQHPGPSAPAGRPVKAGPAYARLSTLGAVWDRINGWEVPRWFSPTGSPPTEEQTFGRPVHEVIVRAEMRAVRNGAGLADLTSDGILEIVGPALGAFLTTLEGEVPAAGQTRRMLLRSAAGGVLSTLRVARLGEDRARIYGPARAAIHDADALAQRCPDGLTVRNLNGARGLVLLCGPKAAAVLAAVGVAAPKEVASAPIGFVPDCLLVADDTAGEAGWLIEHPLANQAWLLDRLRGVGAALIGHLALTGLRVEAGIGHAPADLDIEVRGTMRLVRLALDPPAALLGSEGLYTQGQLVGRIASYGPSTEGPGLVALAVVPSAIASPGRVLSLRVYGADTAVEVIA